MFLHYKIDFLFVRAFVDECMLQRGIIYPPDHVVHMIMYVCYGHLNNSYGSYTAVNCIPSFCAVLENVSFDANVGRRRVCIMLDATN